MASSYSDLGLELMVTGENAGTWGDKTNTNLNLVQQAISGFQAVTVNGTGTTTLAMTDATISNARNAVIQLTGTITGNIDVTIPDGIEKMYTITNGTTGSFTVQFKTVSGTGFTFAATEKTTSLCYSDGTNIVEVNPILTGLIIGTDIQAYDAQLADVAGLAVTDGNIIVGNGSNFVAESGATARTSLGVGTGNDVQFDSFGVGTAASGTTGEIRATNDVTAFYSSDVALKENIVNIPNALDAVKKLNGVLFDWKKSYIDQRGGEDGYFVRKRDVGVIAQEVEKVLPEAVAQRADGVKAVKYDRLTCLLIEAVKQLQDKVDSLSNKRN
jgi:hypothetical protein